MKKIILISLLFVSMMAKAQVAGNALQFDGVNDYIDFGNVDLKLTKAVTVMAWLNWDVTPSSGNSFATIVTNNSSQSQNDGQFFLRHTNGNGLFEFGINTKGSNKSISSRTSPVAGIWYNVTGVYNGSWVVIYVNGIAEDSIAFTGNIESYDAKMNLTIGQSAKNANNYRRFTGVIDNFSVWNKALTPEEIITIYTLSLTGNETGLSAYWNMDESTGTTVNDISFSRYHGANIGTAAIVGSTAPISGVLPVELLYFNTSCKPDTSVEISWATASEANNNFFTLLRSTDMVNWVEIGKVQGGGTTNQISYYSFSDKEPEVHDTYYRLRQTDYDGKSETFNLGSILCKYNHSKVTLFPVPVKDRINLSFYNEHSVIVPVDVDVYNISGNKVMTNRSISVEGQNELSWEAYELKTGTYFLQMTLGDKFLYSGKFTKE